MKHLLWFLFAMSLAASVQAYYRHTYEPQLMSAQEALTEASHNLDDCQRQRDAALADGGSKKSKVSDLTEQIASLTQQLSTANQATQRAVAEGNQWQAQLTTLKEQVATAARAQQQEVAQPKPEPKEKLVLTATEVGDFEVERVKLDALFEQKKAALDRINLARQKNPAQYQQGRSTGYIPRQTVQGYDSSSSLSVFHADDGSTTDGDIRDLFDQIDSTLTKFANKQPTISVACAKAKAAISVYGQGGDWPTDCNRIQDALDDLSRAIDPLVSRPHQRILSGS